MSADSGHGYQIAFVAKPGYLHATVTGRNSRDNVMAYLDEIRRECIARKCPSVLIEERLEGPRLGAPDVYAIASEGSERAVGTFRDIAYVDVNAQGGLSQFAVDVAYNHSLPVTLFRTVAEAEKYLLDRAGRVQ